MRKPYVHNNEKCGFRPTAFGAVGRVFETTPFFDIFNAKNGIKRP